MQKQKYMINNIEYQFYHEDGDFYFKDNVLIWKNGTFKKGIFKCGKWLGGVFQNGTFEDSEWFDGIWQNGIFINSEYKTGIGL